MIEKLEPPASTDAPPTPAPLEPPPPPPTKRRRHWSAIVWVMAVLALALVSWMFVPPRTAPAPTQASIPHQTTHLGVPDITTTPTWADPIKVASPDNTDMFHISATPSIDIALFAWSNSDDTTHYIGPLVAVNLKTQTVVWTKDLGSYLFHTNTQDLIITSGDTIMSVDPTTGTTMSQATLPADAPVIADAPGIVVTRQDDRMCARSVAHLDGCLWIAADSGYGMIFGDSHWIDTGDGVLDLHTGKPAPFGADAGQGRTFYSGPRPSEVFRMTRDTEGNDTLQRWDTAADKGIGDPMAYKGFLDSLGINAFAVRREVNDSMDSVQAYSWQTGEPLWQTADVSAAFTGGTDSAGLALIAPISSSTAGCLALDAGTGEHIWTDPACAYMLAGRRIAYAVAESAPHTPTTVEAHDAIASGFPTLWSVDVPRGRHRYRGRCRSPGRRQRR
ncbi:MAG: hypothetical protein FWF75_01025 [Propionibacteriaceae bacterium]|nr:hypothetical protein [Propionibacteriaceae bacterium]